MLSTWKKLPQLASSAGGERWGAKRHALVEEKVGSLYRHVFKRKSTTMIHYALTVQMSCFFLAVSFTVGQ